jgi:hypothetical protein
MPRGSSLGSLIDDLQKCFTRLVSDPLYLAILVCCAALIYSHVYTPDDSLVKSLVKKIGEKEKLKFLADWIDKNIDKFLGMLAFIPSIASAPANKRAFLAAMAFVWVYSIPEGTPMEYVAQSALLYVFMCTNKASTRLVVFGTAVALYFSGYVHIPGFPVQRGANVTAKSSSIPPSQDRARPPATPRPT